MNNKGQISQTAFWILLAATIGIVVGVCYGIAWLAKVF